MAWDGKYLWLSIEPTDSGQLGSVYQLAIQDSNLEVVNKFPHPAPAPDSIAWDGQTLWTTGQEGPDPYRSWEGGTTYLYKHTFDKGFSVVERYPLATLGVIASGLTWDGQHLWVSNRDQIVRLDNISTNPVIGAKYIVSASQLRAIEWVNGHLWAFDSASNRLYKYEVGPQGLTVEGECTPGPRGSYAMAWDGDGFWLYNIDAHPHLQFIKLPDSCPQP